MLSCAGSATARNKEGNKELGIKHVSSFNKVPKGQVAQGGPAVHPYQKREVSLHPSALVRSLLSQLPTLTAAVVSYHSKYLTGLQPVRCLHNFTVKQKIESLHLGCCGIAFSAKGFYLL